MPALYSVQIRSHTGCVREINEDLAQTVLDWPQAPDDIARHIGEHGHLFAVADGMGGHAAGEVASRTAIDALFTSYYTRPASTPTADLRAAIHEANTAILQKAQADKRYAGMGTTLVAAVLHEQALFLANVGDSRAYLFRQGELRRLTRDHSWVEEQMRAGVITEEEARRHPYRNVITRSLGPDRDAEPELTQIYIQPHDILLLCSDGLSNELTDEELQRFLAAYSLDEAADNMLELAIERGAPDNVTFVLVQFMAAENRKKRRLWPWLLALLLILALATFLLRSRLWPLLATMPATPPAAATGTNLPVPSATPSPAAPVASHIPIDVIELPDYISDAGSRFGGLGAQSRHRGRPLSEMYVLYVRGVLASRQANNDGWQLALAQQDESQHLYRFRIDNPLLAPLPPTGSFISLIGRPYTEDDLQGDSQIEADLLLDATGKPLWVIGDDMQGWLQSYARPLWVFSVFGAGGGNDLKIDTPPGAEGKPLAMWGSWSLNEGNTVQFNAIDPQPYLWEGDAYRALVGDMPTAP